MDVKHVRNNQICVMLPNYVHFEELATKISQKINGSTMATFMIS